MIKITGVFPDSIQAVVTTADGAGNLAAHVGDDPASVVLRRRQLQCQLNLNKSPQWLQQVHGTQVIEHTTEPLTRQQRIADACWTSDLATSCAVLTADCLPVLFASQNGSQVAAAHAGWRGLLAGVLQTTVAALPVPAGQLIAWIGPAISQAHFQVGDEVRRAFVAANPAFTDFFIADHQQQNSSEPRWLCDLPALAGAVLISAGVGKVVQSGWCSFADSQRWYSYRRQPACGRMASLIWRHH
ncbi:MAG: peptidoglycan editing factor PgeF [Idiomarina sp.]